jgi:DNA modification methylase
MPLSQLPIPFLTEWTALEGSRSDGHMPIYHEVNSIADLLDIEGQKARLHSMNWDFTDEDTSYLTHDVHPYPAKFIPQIPGHLIANLSLRGDLVLDPFCGSGTTAFEAVRMGRRALCIDANLIGILVGRAKTSRLDKSALQSLRALHSTLLSHLSHLPKSAADLLDQVQQFVPPIPNIDKWFSIESRSELALIRSNIQWLDSQTARDIAYVAMSKIVTRVSFQDSETRYASNPKKIEVGETIRAFLNALEEVVTDVVRSAPELTYGVARFECRDTRNLPEEEYPSESVDLVITSPPYGNANDYHLYHRFRLFWLGADPRLLAGMEIGSHLRHQKESTGYSSYRDELLLCTKQISRLLRPGRFAAFVIGDFLYKGIEYSGRETVASVGQDAGLGMVTTIERKVHGTRRSFVSAGRRLTQESVVIMRKPERRLMINIEAMPYRLWPYEDKLRVREVEKLASTHPVAEDNYLSVDVDCRHYTPLRRLAFSQSMKEAQGAREKTWQTILENGTGLSEASRKDPKYVTHGLHQYKGKFYPQLAKSLINLAGLQDGERILDPFCGSGTTLLEGYLNGLVSYGCDLNPLAAKIARAKVGILELNPELITESIETLVEKLKAAPSHLPKDTDQFGSEAFDEILSWFPQPVVWKLNWVLRAIRSVSAGILQDFLEVILSSIIRDVSQQEPDDLRIRRRKQTIEDADVLGLLLQRLEIMHERLVSFWSIRGYSPYRFWKSTVMAADARERSSFEMMGLGPGSIDLVLTSPPYATALPYIDTDRLSLLVLLGMTATDRRPLEQHLTGSREITASERALFEAELSRDNSLPASVSAFLRDLYVVIAQADVGFRRKNMPALLLRFFLDMKQILENVYWAMKANALATVVLGDNTTNINGRMVVIPTTRLVKDIASSLNLELTEEIPITVTTEDLFHIKNAIKRNSVLLFRKV